MASWKFVVTNLNYEPLGELTDYMEMSISRRINAVDSGSFRVRGDNPMFATLASQKCMVKGYRDGVLQCFMYVWSAEMVGDAEKVSLAVTLAAPAIQMKRLYTYEQGSVSGSLRPTVAYDRYRLFYHLMSQALFNRTRYAVDPSLFAAKGPLFTELLIASGVPPCMPLMVEYADGITTTMLYDDEPDRLANAPMSDRLQKFAAGTAGFDWYWEPTEPTAYYTTQTAFQAVLGDKTAPIGTELWTKSSNGTIAEVPGIGSDGNLTQYTQAVAMFRPGRPIGIDRSSLVSFEYGTGAYNLSGFALSATREYQANMIGQRLAGTTGNVQYALQGGADFDYATALGRIERAQEWGYMADFTQFDVSDPVYLQQLLDESILLRKEPMRRLSITPTTMLGLDTDPPDFGVDFGLGDTVRATVNNPQTGDRLVDGAVRVHGVAWAVKDSGAETMTLTIQENE